MLTRTSSALYYIALLPPEVVSQEILNLKLLVKDNFKAKRALRSTAHITLVPPFRATSGEIELITNSLRNTLKNYLPIPTVINGFKHFGIHTIFLEVAKNVLIETLFREVFMLTNQVVKVPGYSQFTPHITIASRDLAPNMFTQAITYFSTIPYYRGTLSRQVAIFELISKKWVIRKSFMLYDKLAVLSPITDQTI